ncbi:hypothetical protein [Paenibacillus cremeus]|uniref:Uncharacterized protein n=1 Tax=Paenibacillus cremeus TaxID=2163881 RepID=A0A559K6H6_9BACL|nr:hypothetical protein [Paenibacillus cremeus]TVY07707.1 hypothetical protein FPZ49_22775 [Paenibacillus cremeus]
MSNVILLRPSDTTLRDSKEFEELLDEIISRRLQPEDQYEIVALLESMGWNDARAYEVFGVEDTFALGEELWQALQQKMLIQPIPEEEKQRGLALAYEMLKSFLRGLIFALPMAISVLSMLVLKFSLWSYEYLSVELATCIAIGTILSFVVVGGFTQAIARRGFYFIYQGYFKMARKNTFFFIRVGYLLCFAVSAAIYGFNFIFNIFSQEMFFIIVLYFFFLNSIWLSVTVMYILRKEITFTGLILFGILLVYIMFIRLHMDIIWSQLIAIAVVSINGIALVFYFFLSAEKKEEKGIAPKMPRLSITFYSIMPYFRYGFLYFTFLFVDRVMAWSMNDPIYMPYLIWFRGDYELGLDFALLVLMLPLGVAEVIVHRLMLDIESGQKQYFAFEAQRMNDYFLARYFKMLSIIVAVSIVSALLIYGALLYFNEKYLHYAGKYLVADHITYFVFYVSLLAYVILAVGLMNAVILFSLSQPEQVNRAILPALLTNVIVGFLMTRWFHYSYAVFGLLAGSIVFLILSIRSMKHVLRRLDYYLYAGS